MLQNPANRMGASFLVPQGKSVIFQTSSEEVCTYLVTAYKYNDIMYSEVVTTNDFRVELPGDNSSFTIYQFLITPLSANCTLNGYSVMFD